tara:strand:- start:297 stop:731 length:435 start_codon:yes stop_codon:yes gene_type:complete
MTLPNTNGWSNGWRVVNVVDLPIGEQTSFKIIADIGGFNLKNIIFEDLDVSSVPMKLNLSCYPNPANSFVSIKWNSDFILSTDIDIYSISGSKVFSKNLISQKGENELHWYLKSQEMKKVPSGIYLIKVETSNEVSINKVTYLK